MKNLDLRIFPQTDKSQWLQLAEKQLKGADPNSEMKWQNAAGIELEGYYDQTDVSKLKYLSDFFTTLPSHKWKLYERINCAEPPPANKKSIQALMGGCDGIILDNPKKEHLNELLKGVDADICDVNVMAESEVKSNQINGFTAQPNGNCIQSDEKDNPITQLAEILAGIGPSLFIHRLAHADFFLEIATVRSLRYLLNSAGKENIHIHTHIPLHESEEHQWFLNTTAGLASILGGTHSVDFATAIGDSRISRNTGNLIREESGIEKYEDQCGGSYYVEVLTNKIIEEVKEILA